MRTKEEIVADLRNADRLGAPIDAGAIADQIELAFIGNAAAMREALEFIKLASDDYEQYGNTKAGALDVIYEKACAALSAPPRQCDVGTAKEQYARFNKYCNKRQKTDKSNPCGRANRSSNPCAKCYSMWAQTPYVAEEGAGK